MKTPAIFKGGSITSPHIVHRSGRDIDLIRIVLQVLMERQNEQSSPPITFGCLLVPDPVRLAPIVLHTSVITCVASTPESRAVRLKRTPCLLKTC